MDNIYERETDKNPCIQEDRIKKNNKDTKQKMSAMTKAS